ncbi:MAG TPA: hypothetical protein VGS19_21570 [Streptosporangiaceae bacterium]|nr:hypothetical protein [Streptosporangiaceae bacterium]
MHLAQCPTPASTADRDAAPLLLTRARHRGRARLALTWADNAYHGAYQDWAARELGITVETRRAAKPTTTAAG